MKLPQEEGERWKLFVAVMRREEINRREQSSRLKEAVKSVPVAEEVVAELRWVGPEFTEIMAEHPGCKPDMRLKSLWMMVDIFRQAHADLNQQLNRFHAFSMTVDWSTRPRENELKQLEIAVRKELMGFSTAAAALVGHSRAVQSFAKVPEFDTKRKAVFDEGEHRFITGLRNVISHSHYPRVSWFINYLGDQGRLTDFVLFPSDLLRFGDLVPQARSYLEEAGERIHVRKVIDAYAERVFEFYAWLRPESERLLPLVVRDYRRCLKENKANGARQWWKISLQQIIAKQLNPYDYLDRYLLPNELEHALSLPHRSKEQVDYIVSAVDDDQACDEEVRAMVYKLFSVS